MMPSTWILVADAARATLYRRPKGPHKLIQEDSWETEESRKLTNEIDSDKQGSRRRGGATSPREDAHRHAQHNFAQKLVEAIKKRDGDIERLAVVAPPKMLGELRPLWGNGLRKKIVIELAKDLTHAAAKELEKHVDGLLEVLNGPIPTAGSLPLN
jgi:protein required for attachment to host cells